MLGYGPATVWVIIIAAGVGTYVLKLSFILLLGGIDHVPPSISGVLRFVPPAVLAALIAPEIISLSTASPTAVEFDTAKLAAGIWAGTVAWRTENVLATIGVGMASLWAFQWVL